MNLSERGDQNPTEFHPIYSTATLLRASLFAVLLASLVLGCVILPAEYGIDPTGVGRALGLSQLSNGKTVEPAPEARTGQKQRIDITVPPGDGLEYKVYLLKGNKFEYAWVAKGGTLYFDFHGEPEGAPPGYFESHTISTGDDVRRSLTAPFSGTHGWYWKNDSNSPVVVTLTLAGQYSFPDSSDS